MKEIAALVDAAQSSVSTWVRDISLTSEQRTALMRRAGAARGRSHRERCRKQRQRSQSEGAAHAKRGDAGHVAGCMLYWAEGGKSRNNVMFVNSDPDMVRYFVDFLRPYYHVADEAFRIDCNLFADHIERQHTIEAFWLDTMRLPGSCLRKSTVNVYSKYTEKKRKNRLPYGTVRVCVHSTAVVQSIYGAIQEYGGFDRPEWLG